MKRKMSGGGSLLRGIIGTAVFIGLWQVGTSLDSWTGVSLPIVAQLPPPSSVLDAFLPLIQSHGFWSSAYLSFVRVFWGFIAAMVIGIPFGLLMAVNKTAKAILFTAIRRPKGIPITMAAIDRKSVV